MDAGSAPTGRSVLRRHLVDFVSGIRHWAAKEKSRRDACAEIEALDGTGVLDEVLREFNMERADLAAIVNADPGNPHRLEQMLARLGLTDRMHADMTGVARDVEMVCSRCRNAGKCDHWLSGDSESGFDEFCPNAETFKALRAAQ
jgi:hypothetical protein